MVKVGPAVSTVNEPTLLFADIIFAARSLAHDTLKNPLVVFVSADTFIVHSHIVGVVVIYQFVCQAAPLAVTT